jgi:hypothetical protein
MGQLDQLYPDQRDQLDLLFQFHHINQLVLLVLHILADMEEMAVDREEMVVDMEENKVVGNTDYNHHNMTYSN